MNYYISVLKRYAEFKGRASRAEYWQFILVSTLVGVFLQILGNSIGLDMPGSNQSFLSFVYQLAVIVPTFAVAVRRMHDVNKSGWFLLIPIYNFVLTVTKGDDGKNQYGEKPADKPAQ